LRSLMLLHAFLFAYFLARILLSLWGIWLVRKAIF
jgi:hypothetical protein